MELHITNGDSVGEMLKQSDAVTGDVLCWRDLLHDGPVPDSGREDYARCRGEFLVSALNATEPDSETPLLLEAVLGDFERRNAILDAIGRYRKVTLWFEHDLYDQLQLIEVLKELDSRREQLPPCQLICIGEHPQVPFFHGLADLCPEQLVALRSQAKTLGPELLSIGRELWQVITASEPLALGKQIQQPLPQLPFMQAALLRFAREYPARCNGLTLTQSLLLQAIASLPQQLPALHYSLEQRQDAGLLSAGQSADARYRQILQRPACFSRLFLSLQELEKAPFMGDLWVRRELQLLCSGQSPLLSTEQYRSESSVPGDDLLYRLTSRGKAVLAGRQHWRDEARYDLWRGGVHLRDDDCWYWDEERQQFCR